MAEHEDDLSELLKDVQSIDIQETEYDVSALVNQQNDAESLEKANVKARLIVSTLSLLVGVALMVVKFYVYRLTHSAAVISDILISAMNAGTAVFALGNILLTTKDAKDLQSLRQEKIRYFSAGFKGTLIILATMGVLMAGSSQAFYPRQLSELQQGMLFLLIAGVVKLFLGFKLIRVGERTETPLLTEHGREMWRDMYGSGAVLISLFIGLMTGVFWLDGWVACLIGIHILAKGGTLILLPFKGIREDVSEPDFLNVLVRLVNEHRKDTWIDIHQLRAWHAKKRINIKFHLILPRDFTLERAELESKELRRIFNDKFGGKAANAFIHSEPCIETDCPFCSRYRCPLREREGPKREHRWNLNTLTARGGPAERLQKKEWDVPPKIMSRAMAVTVENRRLMEWLFEIFSEKWLNYESVLVKMEAADPEFRETALAEELLRQQRPELRRMLARMQMYLLPVPKAGVLAVCEDIQEMDEHTDRAAALGLLEITRDASEKVYRMLPLLSQNLKAEFPEDRNDRHHMAAMTLYRIWWEGEMEAPTEAQCLEIFRLALASQAREMALEMSDHLTSLWNDRGEFEKSVRLYEKALKISENNYRLLRNLARVEKRLGNLDNALTYYKQALPHFPEEDRRGRASVLHHMAEIHAKQYRVKGALIFFRQALELWESIHAMEDKADTLTCMAEIYANQEKNERALKLFRQALDIRQDASDMQGKAEILHQMAEIHTKQGETDKALPLYQQSLETKEKIGSLREMEADIDSMAKIYTGQGQINKALNLYQKLLEIKTKLNDEKGKAAIIAKMSQLSVTLLKHLKSPDVEKVKKFMAKN